MEHSRDSRTGRGCCRVGFRRKEMQELSATAVASGCVGPPGVLAGDGTGVVVISLRSLQLRHSGFLCTLRHTRAERGTRRYTAPRPGGHPPPAPAT
eukprot:1217019-Pleurochrysis_carterae.AAC.1